MKTNRTKTTKKNKSIKMLSIQMIKNNRSIRRKISKKI